jgi:hypothetical protein
LGVYCRMRYYFNILAYILTIDEKLFLPRKPLLGYVQLDITNRFGLED